MTPLSPEARARLAAYQRSESPDEPTAARVLAAVERRAQRPTTPAEARRLAELDPTTPAPKRRAIVLGVLALAAGLLLAVRWATTPARHDPSQNTQAPHQAPTTDPLALPQPVPPDRRVSSPVPPDSQATDPSPVPPDSQPAASPDTSAVAPDGQIAPAGATAPVPAVSSPAPSDTPAGSQVTRPRPPTKPASPDMSLETSPRRPSTDADDIAAEVALLREAKLAAPARRRELLAEHARRFETGAFAAERELLAVETLCELGDLEAARAAATRFAQAHPGSPLRARITQTCAGSP